MPELVTPIVEVRTARHLLLEHGKEKLAALSEKLDKEYYAQTYIVTGDVRVRLRGVIETLLHGGTATEMDMMALAWFVSKQEG